jgi:hypothetical protein
VSLINLPCLPRRTFRAPALLRVALASFLILLAASAAFAQSKQNKKDAVLKTVHGSVLDKSENPVPSGVVYLKNVSTLAVRTYISDSSGGYRFSGLDPNVDYELHAEHGNDCSSLRTVSSYDTRRDIEFDLKLNKTNCRK